MPSLNVAIFGIYASQVEAERAIDHLAAAGFRHDRISVLLPGAADTRSFAIENKTHAPEGAVTGVAAGGVTGGALGLLAGLGALAIPGVGPLFAAGPLLAALAGLGVGSALGGIVGTLVGMGVPEFAATKYEGHVRQGSVLLSVHCEAPSEIDAAEDALKATGALDISSSDDHPGAANVELA